MKKITAIITCKNEAHTIAAALESVSWCDEVMVVDSFSTDNTVEIAKKYTPLVLQHEYLSPALQKNWAIPQAANEWVLILDSDECVPAELKQEIQTLLSAATIKYEAFWIPRKNFFLGKEVKYCGWQRDKVIRLFKRDSCRYEEKQVHEEILYNGKTGKLKNKLLHYTYKDIFHYLEKLDRYSTWSAQEAFKKNVRPNFFHFVIKPWFRFWKHYLLDLGILDGRVGFIICSLMSQSVLMRYVKLEGMRRKN